MALVEFFYDFGSEDAFRAARRIEEIAPRHGAVLAWRPVHLPETHPEVDTALAMRLAVACEERGHQLPVLRRLFRARWEEGTDLSDPRTLAALASEAGAPGRRLVERTRSGHVEARLNANTDEARRRGAVGPATFFVGTARFDGRAGLDALEAALAEEGPDGT